MQIVDDLPHAGQWEVVGINGKDPASVHVVCRKVNISMYANVVSSALPISVHMVSSGMAAAE